MEERYDSKKLISSLLAFGFVVSAFGGTNANASQETSDEVVNNSSSSATQEEEYLPVSSQENEEIVLAFESVDDKTGIANDGLPLTRSRQASGIIYTTTWYAGSNLKVVEKAVATGHSTLSQQFVKYLTSSWAKAASYTWSNSNSASWSISSTTTWDVAESVKSALSLSKSRTTTYAVATNIPANSSKLSKLGFASDYFKQDYKYTMTVGGEQTASHNGYIKTPLKDTYLIVYYK